MRAAELITIAGTRHIDLKYIAGNASNVDGVARTRARTKDERRMGAYVRQTVSGPETRSYARPKWTVAEAGQAMKGVPRMPQLAAMYSWCRDRANYRELHAGITLKAFELKESDRWPWVVNKLDGNPGFYVEELGKLVLAVEAYKEEFYRYPELYAACMGVSDEVWTVNVSRCFGSLHAQYERWLGVVNGMGAKWLREDEAEGVA